MSHCWSVPETAFGVVAIFNITNLREEGKDRKPSAEP
jgi:hypothetical protein